MRNFLHTLMLYSNIYIVFRKLFPSLYQFGMMECVVTNLLDEYPKHLRKNEKLYILIVCIVCYLVAIPMVCQVRLNC